MTRQERTTRLFHRWLLALTLTALSPAAIACGGAGSQAESPPGDERVGEPEDKGQSDEKAPFEHQLTVLDNGLQVVTMTDDSAPLVAVQMWYHVGARNERPDRRGFAHLFEHMMFAGTPRLEPAEHMELIRGTGGSSNAYTSFDETVYIQEVPANQLELVLWLESERMAFLRIDEEGFHRERDVVAEEYHKTAEQPYGKVIEELLPAVFGNNSYRWSPIGNMAELQAAEVPELQEFWESWYVPNNAALVVVGDVKHEEVVAMAERYFSWIPSGTVPEQAEWEPAQNPEKRSIELRAEKGPAPVVGLVWRTVPAGHADEPALSMLGTILGGGESSRVYQKLVVEEGAAMVAMAGAFSLEVDGIFGAGAVLSPLGADAEKVATTLQAEVERLRQEGPSEEELQKARNSALRSAVTDQLTAASKATILGRATLIYGDSNRANDYLNRIQSVTREDVQRVANKWLPDQREIQVVIRPSILGFMADQLAGGGSEERATGNDETSGDSPGSHGSDASSGDGGASEKAPQEWGKPGLQRPDGLPSEPPIAAPLASELSPEVERFTLANGLEVVVVRNPEVPFVTASLALNAGAWADPPDAPGTAAVVADMLTRGTTQYDYSALSEALDSRAIRLAGVAGIDQLSVEGSSVSDEADELIRLMAEVVRNPTFDDEQLELVIEQQKTAQSVREESPDYVADKHFRRAVYGDHPYSRLVQPTAEELDDIEASGLQNWWRAVADPGSAVLYVAGDVTPESVRELADQHLGDWASSSSGSPGFPGKPPMVVPNEQPRIILVDRAAEQAQIRVGHTGISRRSEAWTDLGVLGQIFGGGSLQSRLNQRLRGDEGYTYGAYGGFRAGRFGGRFTVQTFSRVATVDETIQTILEEIGRLRTEVVSEAELVQAQRFLTGSYILNRETPQAIVGDLATIDAEGLPADYYDRYLAQVAAATPTTLQDAAREYIDPGRLVIVVVGPASELEEPLREFGAVEVRKSE